MFARKANQINLTSDKHASFSFFFGGGISDWELNKYAGVFVIVVNFKPSLEISSSKAQTFTPSKNVPPGTDTLVDDKGKRVLLLWHQLSLLLNFFYLSDTPNK